MPTLQMWPQGKMEMQCHLLGSRQRGELVSSEEVSETQTWLKPFLLSLFSPGHFKNAVSCLYSQSTLARFTDTSHYRYQFHLTVLDFERSVSTDTPGLYCLDNLCLQPLVSALWTHVNTASAICNFFISRLGFLQDTCIINVLQITMPQSPAVA